MKIIGVNFYGFGFGLVKWFFRYNIKGRNFAYKPVFVRDQVDIGESHTIEITNVTINSLVGKIVS